MQDFYSPHGVEAMWNLNSRAVSGRRGVRLASVEISRPSYTVFYSASRPESKTH